MTLNAALFLFVAATFLLPYHGYWLYWERMGVLAVSGLAWWWLQRRPE